MNDNHLKNDKTHVKNKFSKDVISTQRIPMNEIYISSAQQKHSASFNLEYEMFFSCIFQECNCNNHRIVIIQVEHLLLSLYTLSRPLYNIHLKPKFCR